MDISDANKKGLFNWMVGQIQRMNQAGYPLPEHLEIPFQRDLKMIQVRLGISNDINEVRPSRSLIPKNLDELLMVTYKACIKSLKSSDALPTTEDLRLIFESMLLLKIIS
jgi:hypothetical protein